MTGTKGQVLYWKGALSDGLYHACNGGHTITASLRWNMADTYHTMKDDPYDMSSASQNKFAYTFYKEVAGQSQTLTESRITSQTIEKAAAKLGVAESKIKVLGYSSVTPYQNPEGYPAASKEFTKFKVVAALSWTAPPGGGAGLHLYEFRGPSCRRARCWAPCAPFWM